MVAEFAKLPKVQYEFSMYFNIYLKNGPWRSKHALYDIFFLKPYIA